MSYIPSAAAGSRARNAASTRPITLQARKQQLVRDAIWDAAIDLFAQKGYDQTTVDDIAQAAGTSRRSFFRYFESKSDLMAHGIVSYGNLLTEAIQNCPATDSLSDVFRQTVLSVAQHSARQHRTRKIMEIAAKYPSARDAQAARIAEVQDQVAEAFAPRCSKAANPDLVAHVLAGLTLSVLGVTFRSWFDNGQQDISATAEQVFATVRHLACDGHAHEETPPERSTKAHQKKSKQAGLGRSVGAR